MYSHVKAFREMFTNISLDILHKNSIGTIVSRQNTLKDHKRQMIVSAQI